MIQGNPEGIFYNFFLTLMRIKHNIEEAEQRPLFTRSGISM
jgi:hypothetical protein